MKPIRHLLWALPLLAFAPGCQGGQDTATLAENKESYAAQAESAPAQTDTDTIRSHVERMMTAEDMTQQLTSGLLAQQNHAAGLLNTQGNDYVGFEWNTGVLDVCGEPVTQVGSVTVTDATHAQVAMRYVDSPCYDITYTLHLLWEDGRWKIDDVDYPDAPRGMRTLRQRGDTYVKEMTRAYVGEPADEVLSNLLMMEPSPEGYNNPESILHDNPEAVLQLAEQLRNVLALFKQNPGYTEEAGQQVTDMIARIAAHAGDKP